MTGMLKHLCTGSQVRRVNVLACLVFCVVSTSCVPARYNARPIRLDPQMYAPVIEADFAGNQSVAENWKTTFELCREVRSYMQAEIDAIEARNNALAAVWAGLAAGAGLLASVYSMVEQDDADARVAGVLGLAAAGGAIPTFFFLGTDERAEDVRTRLADVKAKEAETRSRFDAVLSRLRDYELAKNVWESMGPGAESKALELAKLRKAEATTALREAQDGLNGKLIELSAVCQ